MHSGSTKMRKKIALTLTLLTATFANAEIDQSGFFVGLDYANKTSSVEYDSKGSMPYNTYTSDYSADSLSLKAGYQAYFARVYARYTDFEHKDTKRDKFTISNGKVYELNADYIPVFYTNESKDWNIRGLFGVGVGYNASELTEYEDSLLPVGESAGPTQNYMQYGFQVGILVESSYGVSLETAYRERSGNLQEFTDGANNAVFSLKTSEFYLGLNYLF